MQFIVGKDYSLELISTFDFLQDLRANNVNVSRLLGDNILGETAFKIILSFAQDFDKVSTSLGCLDHNIATKVLWLIFKTHFSSKENLWDPLFKEVAGYQPKTGGRYESEDIIWDQIIPTIACLANNIKSALPSHAGTLPERIPNIFIEAD